MPRRRCRACRGYLPPANARRASTAPTGSAATRFRICSCSASARASLRPGTRSPAGAGAIQAQQVEEAAHAALEPFERGAQGEGPYQVQYALQDMMQDLVGIVRKEAEMRTCARRAREIARAGAARRGRRSPRIQPRLARGARSAQPAARIRGRHPLRDRAARKPRRSFPRGLSRQGSGLWQSEHR